MAAAMTTASTPATVQPAWTPCLDRCGDYWCNVHRQHAFECPCPPVDEWPTDPYADPDPHPEAPA
jgi:hypothetical protein